MDLSTRYCTYIQPSYRLKTVCGIFMPEPEGSRHQGEYILVVVVVVVVMFFFPLPFVKIGKIPKTFEPIE